MLEVRDLQSYYGEAHVIHGVSLNVAPGEVVALLGRNGMGKTTIIRSIMGLTPPTVRSGSVRWKGQELIGLRPHDIAGHRVAIVPQGRRLFPSLTVTVFAAVSVFTSAFEASPPPSMNAEYTFDATPITVDA